MPQNEWTPFRPSPADLAAFAADVSAIPDLQRKLVDRNDRLQRPDRVAHQYQIAAGKVLLRIAAELPDELRGIGLFEPGAEHVGVGRISTGLGGPHAEINPDFLGLMLAFRTKAGRRVDFLALNHPASPADDHREFMDVLHATGEAAGADNVAEEQLRFGKDLAQRRGVVKGARTAAHILHQTARTPLSSSAWQPYWTGIVETGPTAARFMLEPVRDDNHRPGLSPGASHLTEDWAQRQVAGDVEFHLDWIPFLDEKATPTERLTEPWEQGHRKRVGTVIFPRADLASEESRLWAALAAEMGANPGNWVHDRDDTIPEPATRFGAARKIAYALSQKGRNALDPAAYQKVFETGRIDGELAQELRRRCDEKAREGHVSQAPL